MDNWYIALAENNIAYDFLHMFWNFHDFRIVDVKYSGAKDLIEVLFEYDDKTLYILLRFEGNVQFYVAPVDFEADWIMCAALRSYDNQMQWINCEVNGNESIESFKGTTFFQGDSLKWAIVDRDRKSIPVSDEFLHQQWREYNYETKRYEEKSHDFTVTRA